MKINKGLFIHIIVTMVTIAAWLFVMGEEHIGITERGRLIAAIAFSNFIAVVCIHPDRYDNDPSKSPYNQQIKLF